MFDNYIKISLRNFKRDKSSFLINVIGLAVGMACSILILLWIFDELNYDRFHENSDRIYRVMEHQSYARGDIFTTTSTPGPLAPALKQEIPEITYAANYTWNVDNLFTRDKKSFKESGIYARPDLFKILTIDLLMGSPDELLARPNSVVISQELAAKYFGNGKPIGKSLIINGKQAYAVTGVFKAVPDQSTLKFDYVFPFEDFEKDNRWATTWGSQGPRTIVALKEGSDKAAVAAKIKDFVRQRIEGTTIDLFLFPYADLYLHGRFENGRVVGGRIEYLRLFAIVATFVLLIACINFMNLSTARSTRRAKEVGIRKSIGASRASLVAQFVGESIIIAVVALLVSLLLVELFLPAFNNLTGKAIAVQYTRPWFLLIFAAVALLTGLVAGSYPAFYLSALRTVTVLKGKVQSVAGEVSARKSLVVFQFVMSVILIVSTVVIYNQIRYVQNKNIGYQKENLVYFPIEGELLPNWETFCRKALDVAGVTHISRANHIFLGRNTSTGGVDWPGKPEDEVVLFETVRADYGLVETLGFRLEEGRAFSREYGLDSARVIVNQAAVEVMGMENPLGQSIRFWNREWEIIGVLKNFHFQNLRYEVAPLLMVLNPENARAGFVRMASGEINETLKALEATFKEFSPAYPFNYTFMDEQYATLYRSEMLVGNLAKYFGILAVLISCLGLLGLSTFAAEQRTKEIGIRKVLGATVTNVAGLLSKDFVKLVLLANLIAWPLAWFAMHKWLQNFAYRIDIGWWVFALAGGLALVIALLTVSTQAIKAALANPVEALRYE